MGPQTCVDALAASVGEGREGLRHGRHPPPGPLARADLPPPGGGDPLVARYSIKASDRRGVGVCPALPAARIRLLRRLRTSVARLAVPAVDAHRHRSVDRDATHDARLIAV